MTSSTLAITSTKGFQRAVASLAISQRVPQRIGIDTETTGIELRHNCAVFMCNIAFEATATAKADSKTWEWEVRPNDRKVLIPFKEAKQIREIVEDPQFVPIFANAKFEVLGLEMAVKLDPYNVLRRCRDIVIESHLLDSSESHTLKDLSIKYANIDTRDVDALKKTVEAAQAIARTINSRMKKLGFEEPFLLGRAETFHYAKRQPDGGWWIVDTWLPKALMKWIRFIKANNPRLAKQVLPKTAQEINENAVQSYCAMDSIRTLVLDTIFMEEIRKRGTLLDIHDNLQTRLLEVVYRMESFGTPVSEESINEQISHFSQKNQEEFAVCAELSGIEGFNPGSGKQLQKLFYEDWKLPITKWTKPKKETTPPSPSTDIDAMCEIILTTEADSVPNQFCRHLILGKKSGTCVNYLQGYRGAAIKRNRWGVPWWWLHPSFNITGTNTTRFSSSNPNAQNIGKGKIAKAEDISKVIKEILEGENISLRKVFGPMPGREWWTADYKQLQLAIFAFVTGDPAMIAAIEAGYDFHDFMTRMIYKVAPGDTPTDGQRTVGKNIDFGYIFGAGEDKIDTVSGIKGLSQELALMFPAASEFIKNTSMQVRRSGVVFAGGYPLQVPMDKPYAGVNYIVQGYEGVIVKQAMIYCHDYLMEATKGQGIIVLNVHDELVFDFPVGMGEDHCWNLRNLMMEAGRKHKMNIGVDFKYTTKNWSDMTKVEFSDTPLVEAA